MCRSSWKGQLLDKPSLNAHKDDPKLLSGRAASSSSASYITCYAPASAQLLDVVPSLTAQEIRDRIGRAVSAQKGFRHSDWTRRRRVLRSLLEWTVDEAEPLAKIASRDSGKTLVDAAFGEILTTCEKLRWTIANAEAALAPDYRS
jgi:acyl-CoA reductase-like NAD-dependent aldehyde dehydrogenase